MLKQIHEHRKEKQEVVKEEQKGSKGRRARENILQFSY